MSRCFGTPIDHGSDWHDAQTVRQKNEKTVETLNGRKTCLPASVFVVRDQSCFHSGHSGRGRLCAYSMVTA